MLKIKTRMKIGINVSDKNHDMTQRHDDPPLYLVLYWLTARYCSQLVPIAERKILKALVVNETTTSMQGAYPL